MSGLDGGIGDASDWEGIAREAALGLRGDGRVEPASVRELLVFHLDATAYALPVDCVREIVRLRELTKVPRAPSWLLGILALRGEVVEVIDLRSRLGLGASRLDRSNRVVVCRGAEDRVSGLVVDGVTEVYRASEDLLRPASGLDVTMVSEICLRDDQFVSLLDFERLLGLEDV
jgi:purine-binding chemotaxis protein CheW